MSAFIWHLFVECPVENMVLYYEEDITFTFTGNDSYVLIYSSENKSLACDDMNQKTNYESVNYILLLISFRLTFELN